MASFGVEPLVPNEVSLSLLPTCEAFSAAILTRAAGVVDSASKMALVFMAGVDVVWSCN